MEDIGGGRRQEIGARKGNGSTVVRMPVEPYEEDEIGQSHQKYQTVDFASIRARVATLLTFS